MNESFPVWPGWTTVKLIGRGSFGAVYEIERDVFGAKEKAALKVIRIPQNEGDIEEMYDSGYDDASVTATFKQHLQSIVNEYTLMRQMNGAANIVNCDDFRYVQHDNGIGWDIFIRMELLTPLTKALERVPSEEQVRRVGEDMCAALSLCRRHGIIHRDIKPQNIFLSPNGDYKLGDFGIAKTIEKTSGGTKIGTYKYMAPEVYAAKPYNLTADIYSLGLVLHWLLNERRSPFLPLPPAPVEASAEESARMRRFSGEPVPPPAHGSAGLKRIVLKACAFDPAARYQSAEEMLADLRALGIRQPDGEAAVSTSRLWEKPSADVFAPAPGPDDEATLGSPMRRSMPQQSANYPQQRPVNTAPQSAQPLYNRPAQQTRGIPQQGANYSQPASNCTQQSRAVPQQTAGYAQQNASYPPQGSYTQAESRPAGGGARSGGRLGKKGMIILFSVLGALLLLGALYVFGVLSRSSALFSGNSAKDGDWVLIKSTYSNEKGPYSFTTYDYDADGNRAHSSYYVHDGFNGYTTYNCDTDGNVIEEIREWSIYRYEYNADGLCVKETDYSTYMGSEILSGVYTWSYDSEGRTNGYEYYLLDDSGGEYYRYTSHYDGFKLVGYTVNDGGAVSEFRVSQTYDKNGNLTHQENFRDGESTAFYATDISYDKYGNKTGSVYTRTDEDGSFHSGEYVYEYMRRRDVVSAGGYTAERYVHADDLASVRAGLQSSVWELKDYILAGWHDDGSSADASLAGDGSVGFRLYTQGSEQRIEVTNLAENAFYTLILNDNVLQRAEIRVSGGSVEVTPVYNASGAFTDMRIKYDDGSVSMLSSESYYIMSLSHGGVNYLASVYGTEGSPGVLSSVDFNIRIPDDGRLFLTFDAGRISYINIYDTDFNTVLYSTFPGRAFGDYAETLLYADVTNEFSVPGVSRVVETRKFSSEGDMIKRSALTYYDSNDNDTHHFSYFADGSFSSHYEIRYDSDGRYKEMVSYDEDGNVIN